MLVDEFIKEVKPQGRAGRINMPKDAVHGRFIVLPEKYRFEVEAILEREPTSLGKFLTPEEIGEVRYALLQAIERIAEDSQTANRLKGYHRDLETLQPDDARKMLKHIAEGNLRKRMVGFVEKQGKKRQL